MRRTAPVEYDERYAHEPPTQVIEPGAWREVHLRSLTMSTALSRHYVKNAIAPEAVIDVLNAAGIRFLLAGAHAIGGWTNEPRTTQDVDVLVAARQVRAAVRALRGKYPHLKLLDTPVVARLADPESGKVVIDVMKPNQPLHRVALRHAYRVETAKRAYLIPSLEFALAMKFAAMVSPHRVDTKKLIDAADFITIVRANPGIALAKLCGLGERVYPGGGEEIVDMVRRARAGERLIL